MSHGHAHEEAEHATHHSHDPFDRRVAMSMVAIAAVLAAIKVLGHRTHNDTLAYQIKAGVAHTQESDQWNFFQSKKMREVLAKLEANLLQQEAERGSRAGSAPDDKVWAKQHDSILKELEDLQKDLKKQKEEEDKEPAEMQADPPDEAAANIAKAGRQKYDALLKAGLPAERAYRVARAEMTAARYRAESRYIAQYATEKKKDALEYAGESDHKHHQAYYFDLGELGVELALVLSSVAILTKRPGYWYGGIGVGAVGVVVVLLGFTAH
jgi:hypothetical protein